METKLDSRQGQFPASFPDTFKDFFAMMSEDEDHLDLFSNLLEDKVIPRTRKFNQRRCGGSLRCTNNSSSSIRGGEVGRGGGGGGGGDGSGSGSLNVGRSNSFRVNRSNNSGTPANSSFCKHVRYCCLHQKHYSQNFLDYGHGHMCRRGGCDGESCNDDSSACNGGGCGGAGSGSGSGSGLQTTKNTRRAIMERSFEFDSCDESDTISTSSSTPTIPYSALSRHSFHQQQQQQQHPSKDGHYSHHHQQNQHQHQQQHNQSKGYHTKDSSTATLPRIGLRSVEGSSASNNLGTGSSTNNCTGTSGSVSAATGHNNPGGTSNGVINSISTTTNNLHGSAGGGSGGGGTGGSGSSGGGGGGGGRPLSNLFMDLNSPTERLSASNMLSGGSSTTNRPGNIRAQKSPILNRRRSSSIAANLLTADIGGYRNTDETRNHSSIPHSSTRERISHVKSPVSSKGKVAASMTVESSGGVLTFKQAMSGAVSPQYAATSPIHMGGSNNAMASVLEAATDGSISPTPSGNVTRGDGGGGFFCGSSATIAQLGNKQKQRLRTSSMPAESRKPRLADTRRAAIHCADLDLEYYRLRSFSITSHGVCNLGDSLRSRRSRSINSVTSTGTSNSGKDRNNSNASRTSGDIILDQDKRDTQGKGQIPAYKIAMLGASGVGKTALTYQFTTSDYICAYDLSLDDDYGQKTVSVLVDGIETDLEIIDHPACEMSTESFCSTYNIDLFVVVYSVVDRSSFKAAEKVLHYLKDSEMLLTRGAILVGNKTDLERHREVTRQNGRKLAKEIACKFIETSSGLDHNVDELLVGVVAQVKLNPQRVSNLSEKDRQRLNLQTTIQKHRRMQQPRKIVRQTSMCQQEPDENSSTPANRNKSGPVRKTNKRTLNLESILKMGESELEDEDEMYRLKSNARNKKEHFKVMTTVMGNGDNVGSSSCNSSPKSRHSSYESGGGGSSGRKDSCHAETSLLEDCNKKTVSKLTNRTKVFLSSVLRFKKAINVKRRSSSSCSDLFVI